VALVVYGDAPCDRVLVVAQRDHGRDPVLDANPAPRALGSEYERLPVHDRQGGLELGLAVLDLDPLVVVVDGAVLQDLDEGGAGVLVSAPEHLLKMPGIVVDRPRREGRPRPEGEADRVEGVIDRTHRRRGGHHVESRRRRVLALREAIHAIVEEEDLEVEVAPDRVKQVVAADRQPVAIPRHHPHRELGTAGLDSRGERRGASVNRVEAIRVHVVREAARATDARNEHHVLARDAELWHQPLHVRENRVVAAAGTPADVLVGFEIPLGELRGGFAHQDSPPSAIASIRSRISPTRNGCPVTLVRLSTGSRYSARSRRAS
jgi:hypothetical protein